MKNYRLKKEAVQFFLDKHATAIYDQDKWEDLGVDIKALEEVEDAYISYGHKINSTSSSLCGWDENGSHFHFTIHFPSVKFSEHDKFSKGKISRDLMNTIQSNLNYFYSQFAKDDTANR